MNDTSPFMEQKMIDLFAARTPSERVAMASSMYDTSRQITESALRRDHPEWTRSELRREIFLRYYGDEFGDAEKEKIVAWLMCEKSNNRNHPGTS